LNEPKKSTFAYNSDQREYVSINVDSVVNVSILRINIIK